MEYEVRWSRSQKRFVWVGMVDRDEDGVYHGEEFVSYEADGLCEVVETDNAQGRLHMAVDDLHMDGENLFAIQHPMKVAVPEGAVKMEGAGRWRMCYRRSANDWRMRDEDGSGKVTMVRAIRGQLRLNWHDHQAHLFHMGEAWFFEGITYLVPKVGE